MFLCVKLSRGVLFSGRELWEYASTGSSPSHFYPITIILIAFRLAPKKSGTDSLLTSLCIYIQRGSKIRSTPHSVPHLQSKLSHHLTHRCRCHRRVLRRIIIMILDVEKNRLGRTCAPIPQEAGIPGLNHCRNARLVCLSRLLVL